MGEVEQTLEGLYAKAKANPQRIAFPEAHDGRVLAAAQLIAENGWGFPVLVGDAAALRAQVADAGYDAALFEFFDAADESLQDALVARYDGYPRAKLQGAELKAALTTPLMVAALMQAVGEVRLVHAGYIATTADVLRAVIRIIRPNDNGLASSVGMVLVPEFGERPSKVLFLADISTCPDPTPEQLARIAIDSCDTANTLMGSPQTCAMLSYSTKGSASGPIVEKVQEATRLAREMRPDLLIDGELQLDAAVDPVIGAKKAGADNPVAGKAKVLVFPDLNASNIGVKLLEQYAGAHLYGAILQGLQQVCCDSSRGAALQELVGTILAAAVLAGERA